MSQSHTVIFTSPYGGSFVVRVHGATGICEALDTAKANLGNHLDLVHVTTIVGAPDTHTPRLSRFAEVGKEADEPSRPRRNSRGETLYRVRLIDEDGRLIREAVRTVTCWALDGVRAGNIVLRDHGWAGAKILDVNAYTDADVFNESDNIR